jgi:hypothetical protein
MGLDGRSNRHSNDVVIKATVVTNRINAVEASCSKVSPPSFSRNVRLIESPISFIQLPARENTYYKIDPFTDYFKIRIENHNQGNEPLTWIKLLKKKAASRVQKFVTI